MGNLTFIVLIVLSTFTVDINNKNRVWNPVVCSCISGSRHAKNLCYTQQSDLLSSMPKLEREFCDTEHMLKKGSTVVIILNCFKHYCSCSCVITYLNMLKLKINTLYSICAEVYIHLVKAQRWCTRTWYLKSNSSLSVGCTHDIPERHETHTHNGVKKKTELLSENYNIIVRLPPLFHNINKHPTVPIYDSQLVSKPLFKLEKILIGLILTIVECIFLFSYVKHGLKLYNSDFSSSFPKLRENENCDTINPQMKELSLKSAKQTEFKAEVTTSFVFRFRGFNIDHSFVYPASLDHYFKEVFHSKQSQSNLYKYEWARYQSFKHYPESAFVMPLLLSKDGFYYTGYEDEVTCHFCSFKYRNWKRGDNVHNIHKQLSRNCKFVSGGETDNVSITGCNGQFNNDTSEGACVGSSDINVVTENLNKLNLTETTESLQNTDRGEKLSDAVKKNIQATSNDNDKRNGTVTAPVSPKHPAYAVDAVRLSSYSKWPAVVSPSSTVLCDAGFFYAGFGDCVRCFFCGGGLRNWEYGDTPWVEHARWYPTCGYLLKRKGRQFIDMHRQDRDRDEEVTEACANSEYEEATAITNDQEVSGNASFEEEAGPAIQTILEMGYAQDIVLSAIEIIRQKGACYEQYTATDIMEIILENERKSSDPTINNNTLSAQNGELEDSQSCEHPPLLNGNTTSRPGGDMARPNKLPKTKKQQHAAETSYLSKDCQSLMLENRQLKDQLVCKICMEKDACMVFLPCGHMVACQKCSSTVRKCCICRKAIKDTVKAYL